MENGTQGLYLRSAINNSVNTGKNIDHWNHTGSGMDVLAELKSQKCSPRSWEAARSSVSCREFYQFRLDVQIKKKKNSRLNKNFRMNYFSFDGSHWGFGWNCWKCLFKISIPESQSFWRVAKGGTVCRKSDTCHLLSWECCGLLFSI